MPETYVIETDRLKVELPTATMSMTVTDKVSGHRWEMADETFDEVVLERNGVVTTHALSESSAITARQLGSAALVLDFADYRLQLILVVEGGRLDVQMSPGEENQRFKIKGLTYPRPFKLAQRSDAYIVAPFEQGMLVPGDWDDDASHGGPWQFDDEQRMRTYGELFDIDVSWWSSHRPTYEPSLVNNMLMPWFGVVDEGAGKTGASFLAVLDEASWPDTHLWLKHPKGGPTTYHLLWLPSWGKLSFSRRMSFHFFDGGDYVSLCKAYREIAEARGKCVTLRDKNEQNPTIGRLVGSVNTTFGFLSRSYKSFQHKVNMSFEEGANRAEAFSKAYDLRLFVNCRSWQQRGHDHQYPDLVPPAPDCGGPVEFDKMATRIQKLGHVLGLGGDNYHDVSMESPLLEEATLLRYADGTTNRRNFWASGPTSMLCAGAVMKYIRRNFEIGRVDYPPTKGLLETAHMEAYWIGNYVSTYECYDEDHPMTRTMYWDAQREIFQYINDKGLVLNNEHPKDWAAPYFYMARTRQRRKSVYGYDRSGDLLAVPVPLWGLVFHDCLITGGDNALLQMMNGSPPQISLPDPQEDLMVQVRTQATLQAAVGYEPMTAHRFLSDDRRVQESEFGNGVSVWVDENEKRYRIRGVDGIEEEEKEAVVIGRNYY